jgi:hypothetical protein
MTLRVVKAALQRSCRLAVALSGLPIWGCYDLQPGHPTAAETESFVAELRPLTPYAAHVIRVMDNPLSSSEQNLYQFSDVSAVSPTSALAATLATQISNATDLQYAETLIKPWTSAGCDPPRLDYPRWSGFPVAKCAYSDIGATVHTYMMNADREKLARWTVTACQDAKANNMRGCIRYLTSEMSNAASFSIFPIAGYIPEPEGDGLCYLFRDGVTVKTKLRPHFAKPMNQSCGDDEAENELPLMWAGLFARVASTIREDYQAVHPDVPVSGLQWVDVTRAEYQKAWTSDRNELISVKAIRARKLGKF